MEREETLGDWSRPPAVGGLRLTKRPTRSPGLAHVKRAIPKTPQALMTWLGGNADVEWLMAATQIYEKDNVQRLHCRQLEHGATAGEILKRTRTDTAGLIVLGVYAESQFARKMSGRLPAISIRGSRM